jgi:hypothetical protein
VGFVSLVWTLKSEGNLAVQRDHRARTYKQKVLVTEASPSAREASPIEAKSIVPDWFIFRNDTKIANMGLISWL